MIHSIIPQLLCFIFLIFNCPAFSVGEGSGSLNQLPKKKNPQEEVSYPKRNSLNGLSPNLLFSITPFIRDFSDVVSLSATHRDLRSKLSIPFDQFEKLKQQLVSDQWVLSSDAMSARTHLLKLRSYALIKLLTGANKSPLLSRFAQETFLALEILSSDAYEIDPILPLWRKRVAELKIPLVIEDLILLKEDALCPHIVQLRPGFKEFLENHDWILPIIEKHKIKVEIDFSFADYYETSHAVIQKLLATQQLSEMSASHKMLRNDQLDFNQVTAFTLKSEPSYTKFQNFLSLLVKKMPALKKLDLSHAAIEAEDHFFLDSAVLSLPRLNELVIPEMRFCIGSSDQGFVNFWKLIPKKIKHLDVSHSVISTKRAQTIADHFDALHSLIVRPFGVSELKSLVSLIQIFKKHKDLQFLSVDLSFCHFLDWKQQGTKIEPIFPHIEEIVFTNLVNAEQVGIKNVIQLCDFSSLKKVRLLSSDTLELMLEFVPFVLELLKTLPASIQIVWDMDIVSRHLLCFMKKSIDSFSVQDQKRLKIQGLSVPDYFQLGLDYLKINFHHAQKDHFHIYHR